MHGPDLFKQFGFPSSFTFHRQCHASVDAASTNGQRLGIPDIACRTIYTHTFLGAKSINGKHLRTLDHSLNTMLCCALTLLPNLDNFTSDSFSFDLSMW